MCSYVPINSIRISHKWQIEVLDCNKQYGRKGIGRSEKCQIDILSQGKCKIEVLRQGESVGLRY